MSQPGGVPVCRRDRPVKPALARAEIVAAAVRVLRSDGLQRVTMRRLAQELDTGAASLYVYVKSAGEVQAAVLDVLLGELDLSCVEGAGDWRDRLTELLRSYVTVLTGHPGLARSALITRPAGTNAYVLAEEILCLVREGGVPADRAGWATNLLLHLATAIAAQQPADDWSCGDPDQLTWSIDALIDGIVRTRQPA